MTRKKPKGWRNRKPDDPWRHAQAARGIKTGRTSIEPTSRERKLQAKLGRKTKKELIKMGDKYGFMFDESASKADMVAELATAIMETALTGFTPGEQKEMKERTLGYLTELEEQKEKEMKEQAEQPLVVIEEKPRPDDLFRIQEREQVIPRPVAKPPTKFTFDFSKAVAEDTEELFGTRYYGGTVTVNEIPVEIDGSDRSHTFLGMLDREIERQLGRVLTEDERDGLREILDEARHSPEETHLPAVVEWRPKGKQKSTSKHDIRNYVKSIRNPSKKRYAQKYLDYYTGKGPEPNQPMPGEPGYDSYMGVRVKIRELVKKLPEV